MHRGVRTSGGGNGLFLRVFVSSLQSPSQRFVILKIGFIHGHLFCFKSSSSVQGMENNP